MPYDSGPDAPERGFFRGREFRTLLILGGLMVAGWALVYYFSIQNGPPEPVKPPVVADIAPLPPPDPDLAFRGLRDKTPSSPIDDAAKELAFKRIREARPADLRAKARRGVTPQELLQHPSRYRGLPVHLEGYAKFVAVDEVPGLTPANRFYEVWMAVPPDRRYPCCLMIEDAPKTLPVGRDLEEKIVFDGYFLKLMSYQAVDVERFAPLLVGRLDYDRTTAVAAKQKRSIWWTIWPLGFVFGYLGLRVAFSLKKNLGRRSEPRQFFRIEEDATFAKPDRIEPEDLKQWLERGATHDPE